MIISWEEFEVLRTPTRNDFPPRLLPSMGLGTRRIHLDFTVESTFTIITNNSSHPGNWCPAKSVFIAEIIGTSVSTMRPQRKNSKSIGICYAASNALKETIVRKLKSPAIFRPPSYMYPGVGPRFISPLYRIYAKVTVASKQIIFLLSGRAV